MNWLPYPENIPKEDKEYLLTIGRFVTIARYCSNFKFYSLEKGNYYAPGWENESMGGVYQDVKAFMEKPSPYKG